MVWVPPLDGGQLQYDATSHLTQVTDPSGIYVLTYDRMGRLTGTNTQYTFMTG